MTEFKLFNTDGKTFFDFRSSPDSRCEGFTLTYCDDGTVVMSGDYGTLCWKRNFHHEGDKEFRRDYGFPNKETGIGYFEEKICQYGIQQKIREFNKEYFIEQLKKYYGKEEKWKDFEERVEYIDENNEWEMYDIANEYFTDAWEVQGSKYTEQFIFMFKALPTYVEIRITGELKQYAQRISTGIKRQGYNHKFWVRGTYMHFLDKKKHKRLYTMKEDETELFKERTTKNKDGSIQTWRYKKDKNGIIIRWRRAFEKGEGLHIRQMYKYEGEK